MSSFEEIVKKAGSIDKLFVKMKEQGLSRAKATCPSCGEKTLVLTYSGPRAASASCKNCDFRMIA